MTEIDIVQAISINLLRMAEWYYKDPQGNKVVCGRYLEQSKQLGQKVAIPQVQPYLKQLQSLSLPDSSYPSERVAERFLTLGVLLQHK